MADPKITTMKKVTAEEAKKLDRNKMYTGRPVPESKEVEGQYKKAVVGLCPHCGAANYVIVDTDYWTWFTCWYCGNAFRA